MSNLNICVAGATGWTGAAIAEAVAAADDLTLRSAVSRSAAGTEVARRARVRDRRRGARRRRRDDRLHLARRRQGERADGDRARRRGRDRHVGADRRRLRGDRRGGARARRRRDLGRATSRSPPRWPRRRALLAARHLPSWEIIDYASAGKADAPSGTARELAEALGEAARERSLEDTHGAVEARGADIGGTQVHSLRLPSFTVSTEIVFGLPDERLSIRHDAGSSAAPYVAGTLLAARAAPGPRRVSRAGSTRCFSAADGTLLRS